MFHTRTQGDITPSQQASHAELTRCIQIHPMTIEDSNGMKGNALFMQFFLHVSSANVSCSIGKFYFQSVYLLSIFKIPLEWDNLVPEIGVGDYHNKILPKIGCGTSISGSRTNDHWLDSISNCIKPTGNSPKTKWYDIVSGEILIHSLLLIFHAARK